MKPKPDIEAAKLAEKRKRQLFDEVILGNVPKPDNDEEHARRGPSVLKNKELCLGFVSHKKESGAATRGTLMHAEMEAWGKAVMANKVHATSEDFDAEQIEHLDTLKDYMLVFLEDAKAKGATVIFEHRLDLRSLNLPGCEFGTADVIIICLDGSFHIFDYKFGKVEVDDPEENVQFHAYAVGAFLNESMDRGKTTSLQPYLNSIGDAEFVRADIPRLLLRLKVITEQCEALGVDYDFAKGGYPKDWGDEQCILSPQTSLCEYCANVGTCPAVANFALKATDFLDVPESPVFFVPSEIKDNPKALGELYSWVAIMEKKFEAMKNEIQTIVYQGGDIEGFSLRSSSGKSSTFDPIGMAETARKEFGLTDEQIISCSDIALGKICKLIGKTAKKGEQGKKEEEAKKSFIDGGFVQFSGGYSYLQKSGKSAK